MNNFHELHFEISNKCILKCRHCSSAILRNNVCINYNLNDMVRFISAFQGPKDIFLTGGEPLLTINLEEILLEINSIPEIKNIGLFTTGLVLNNNTIFPISNKESVRLYSAGLRICYVSIYDFENDAHDFLTDLEGSFNKTIKAVNNMKSVGIDIRFNVVIYSKNIIKMREIYEFAVNNDVSEVRFLKLIEHGNAENEWENIGVKDEIYEEEIKKVINLSTNKCRITVSSLPQIIACRPNINSEYCQAGSNLVYIDYLGNVYPCACVKNNPNYLLGYINDVDNILHKLNINYNKPNQWCLARKETSLL